MAHKDETTTNKVRTRDTKFLKHPLSPPTILVLASLIICQREQCVRTRSGWGGIPYRIPYTCRYSRAAEMLSIGIAPGDAAKQLGHSLEMFYRVYAEWIEDYADATDFSRFETKNRPKRREVELTI